MAAPKSLRRPPAGHRYDPEAIDATGATLGAALIAVSDGTGGQRAGYGTPTGSLPAGVTGAVLAYDGASWIAAKVLTDAVSGDVIVDAITGDVILLPA